MDKRLGKSGTCAAMVAALLIGNAASPVLGDAFGHYVLTGSFELPTGTSEFDMLDDGRIVAIVGSDIYIEDDAGLRTFSLHGTLPSADIGFGAAFLRVSPDGTRIAVGNNGGQNFVDYEVGVFDLSTLTGVWFVAEHFQAAWINNSQIALTASDFTNGSSVTVLDTTSPNPADPINPVIIGNIAGASGGIAFDASGVLFTGNGFATIDPSATGTIMAFDSTAWTMALGGGTTIDFETEGLFVVDVLSASPLQFDAEGNLLVGGGSDPPDNDAVAVVRSSAITDALAGQGPIDAGDSAVVRRLDPIPSNDSNFFSTDFNRATGEFYVRDFGASTVFAYRVEHPFAAFVIRYDPAPGQFVSEPTNGGTFVNNPQETLGPPNGAGTENGAESVVTLGDFGGSITLGFDHTVMDDPLNPFGMDAIVFGNAFWRDRDPQRHWAECATIEISLDRNGNGWPDEDEPWFLIPGSHLPEPWDQRITRTWDDDTTDGTYPPASDSWIPPGATGVWFTEGFELPAALFGPLVVVNPSPLPDVEGIWGYADYAPTLVLGDMTGDNMVDDASITPDAFYIVPDDPLTVGMTPGSGGGDAFDIAWAIDPITGEPANLDGFDFIRITSAVNVEPGQFGEKSAEIDAVADAAIDPQGDYDGDGDIDLMDFGAVQNCFGDGPLRNPQCERLSRDADNIVDMSDLSDLIRRFTGPIK